MELLENVPQEHKAIFDRVWQRVMNGSEAQSPVTWEGETALPDSQSPAESEPPADTTDTTTPTDTANGTDSTQPDTDQPDTTPPAVIPCPDHPASDFPQGEDVGVLGQSCLEWGPLLQELIRRCLSEQKEYMKLSRRLGGTPGRVFAALAKGKLRQAKRLAAAYFLISGVHYWPQGEEAPAAGSYLGMLRRRFRQEQENMAACLAGAEGCGDPSLAQLFREVAKEDWNFSEKLRALVEQA